MPGGELAAYAELFKENHITGKRLFLVTMDDLLHIGMFSVGHRRELLVGGPLECGLWVRYVRCGVSHCDTNTFIANIFTLLDLHVTH